MSALTTARRPPTRPQRVPLRRGTEAPRPSGSPLRVVVGDDDPLYQAGITHVLREAGLDVVASASSAENLARKVRAHHPDVAIMDMEMSPHLAGEGRVEAARAVRAIDPRMAVLLLSEFAEERHALEVLDGRPEGFGYLLKARIWDADDLTASVRRVARGGTAIDPVLVARLAGHGRSEDPMDDLTKREREVLALMAEGRTNRCIADALVVSVTAVERHISSIFAKLDLPPNPAEHRRVLAVLRYLDR